jgi:hypothetical protein
MTKTRTLLITGIFLLLSAGCNAQQTEKITAQYLGSTLQASKNKSFINLELHFYVDGDTLLMNRKLPFDTRKNEFTDTGLFDYCHLDVGYIYSFTLKRICLSEIPEIFHSYYRINTIPDENDCSLFTEIEKDTPFMYYGDYRRYVDIGGALYEVTGLSPCQSMETAGSE